MPTEYHAFGCTSLSLEYSLPDGSTRVPGVGRLAYSEQMFDIFAVEETTVITVTLTLVKNDGLRSGQTFSVVDSRNC